MSNWFVFSSWFFPHLWAISGLFLVCFFWRIYFTLDKPESLPPQRAKHKFWVHSMQTSGKARAKQHILVSVPWVWKRQTFPFHFSTLALINFVYYRFAFSFSISYTQPHWKDCRLHSFSDSLYWFILSSFSQNGLSNKTKSK